MPLTLTARSEIGVSEVIKLLWLGSDGRLCPYRPVGRVEPIDFLVKHADDAATLGVQVLSCFALGRHGQVKASTSASTFKAVPFTILIVLDFRVHELRHGPFCWLMRADEFASLATRSRGLLLFEASPRPDAVPNRYKPWRYEPMELAAAVETLLEHLRIRGPRQALPTRRPALTAARRKLGLGDALR